MNGWVNLRNRNKVICPQDYLLVNIPSSSLFPMGGLTSTLGVHELSMRPDLLWLIILIPKGRGEESKRAERETGALGGNS